MRVLAKRIEQLAVKTAVTQAVRDLIKTNDSAQVTIKSLQTDKSGDSSPVIIRPITLDNAG